MKRKMLTALICSVMMALPVCASSENMEAVELETDQAGTDLVMPDSIEVLWQMYLDLLTDYNELKEAYCAICDDNEILDKSDIFFECKSGKLTFDHYAILTKPKKNKDSILCLFFNYENTSDETNNARSSIKIELFQNGVAQSNVQVLLSGVDEITNISKDVRPGSDLMVAYTFYVNPPEGVVEFDIHENVFGHPDAKTFTIDITDAPVIKKY